MPLMKCQVDGKQGWKWGESGKCFSGSQGRSKALEQGRAIEASKARQRDEKPPTAYQSLLFRKDSFERVDAAKRWATEHQFSATDPRETPDTWQIQQRPMMDFYDNTFRTIALDSGVSAVVGQLKSIADSVPDAVEPEVTKGVSFTR
jgi:hypothetical protein